MRIVHFESGRKLYGGAYQVAGIIRHLGDPFQHHLVADRHSDIGRSVPESTRIHPLAIRGELDPSPYFALRRIFRQYPDALLHVHSRRGADIWGPLAARRARRPFLVSRRVDNRESPRTLRWKYHRAAAVIGISAAICRVLESLGVPRQRIHLVRSGVDTNLYPFSSYKMELPEDLAIPRDGPVVAIAAQFIPRKGHADLVAAAPEILKFHPRTRFLLLGQGRLQSEIETLVKEAGLADAFVFAGFRTDLPAILAGIDVLAHPAHLEGLGVAVLQAMSVGRPVVAARAGGLPEIVHPDRTGSLVPPGDPHALASAICAILDDPVRAAEMGRAAREWVVANASLKQTADGNAEIYRGILHARSSDHPLT